MEHINSNKIRIKSKNGWRVIGEGHPVFIIAEMSGNHNHDINRAFKMIDVATQAGVDAVKLQTYTPDTLTIDSHKKHFQIKVDKAWKGQSLYSLYQKAYTPWEWQPKLKKYAESKGLILFSTPFDETAVDFLEKMEVQIYKIASFEIVDIPFLKKIGNTKKPVIMSRGMASLEEILLAINTLRKAGCPQIALLQCISSYPATYEEMNLATIPDMKKKFKTVVGLSNHALDNNIDIIATALGASIIEKHFILKRADGGPDAEFSLEPHELKLLVESVRKTEKTIGKPSYDANKNEAKNIIFRRSLFVVKNIKKGEHFTSQNIRSIRPGNGLPPKCYDSILKKMAKKNISTGTPLSWDLVTK